MSARTQELIIDRNTIFSEIFINTMLSIKTNAILRFLLEELQTATGLIQKMC